MELQIFEKSKIKKSEWTRIWNTVKGLLSDTNPQTSLCQGLVSPKYIRTDSSKSVEYLIFGSVASGRPVRKGREPKRDIKGFLIGNTTEIPEFLYVDVVCANYPGLGDLMLGEAEEYAKRNGMFGIALSSMPHVVGYYRRLGFQNRKDCSKEHKELKAAFEKLAKPLISKYKKDVAMHINTKEGKDYREFLTKLISHKLAKNKKCKTLKECNVDGFVMTKCF